MSNDQFPILKCSKCLTEGYIFGKYAYLDYDPNFKDRGLTKVYLCKLCNDVYSEPLLQDFMRDDFGKFPVSEIMRSMINARIKRAKGESSWQTEKPSE